MCSKFDPIKSYVKLQLNALFHSQYTDDKTLKKKMKSK